MDFQDYEGGKSFEYLRKSRKDNINNILEQCNPQNTSLCMLFRNVIYFRKNNRNVIELFFQNNSTNIIGLKIWQCQVYKNAVNYSERT